MIKREDLLSRMCAQGGTLYFVGIGGSGMYGVARLARSLGFRVAGCDARESANTRRLREEGIPLFAEDASVPPDTVLTVYSFAVSPDHPRLRESAARGIPTIDRAAFFGELMLAFPTRAAVAGTHGKSTTVAMCAAILAKAGASYTVVSGADLDARGSYRECGRDILLFEACEYKDAFLSFSPTHALVLDTERDHTDYFATDEAVARSFAAFLDGRDVRASVAPNGVFKATVTFGNGGRVWAENVSVLPESSSFDLVFDNKKRGRITLHLSGAFEIRNALAAAALCFSMGISAEAVTAGLSSFCGIARRMERRLTVRGTPLYLDFAHHPTELSAALDAARAFGKPVACVFELHTFSRARAFRREYVRLLKGIDHAALLPVYPAREPDEGIALPMAIAEESGAEFLPDYTAAARFLERAAEAGFFLLLAGAGGVEEVLSYL